MLYLIRDVVIIVHVIRVIILYKFTFLVQIINIIVLRIASWDNILLLFLLLLCSLDMV